LPGQKAKKETFETIRKMRKYCRECIIEVDGGMNKETAKKAVEAGANIIVTASAVFNGDIKKNLEELNASVR
jgi:ribulose-phosphate 3-epimerase